MSTEAKKEVKLVPTDRLKELVTELYNSVKRDDKYGIDNEMLFKAKPYKDIIKNIDNELSKISGLTVEHIPSSGKYEFYTKDSFLRDGIYKMFRDLKHADKIFKNIKDEIPKVRNGKVSGKNEIAAITYIRADLYDLIMNHDMDTDKLLGCILGEVQLAVDNIANMNSLLTELDGMTKKLKNGKIDNILMANGYESKGVSNTTKIKNIVDIFLSKVNNGIVLVNNDNPYFNNGVSNEDEGRTKIPMGTRISYAFLLAISIVVLIMIASAGLANFIALGYLLLAYVAYLVVYGIVRLVLIIFTGYDISEKPSKKDAISMFKSIFTSDVSDVAKVDSDIKSSLKYNDKIIDTVDTAMSNEAIGDTSLSIEDFENIEKRLGEIDG